MNDDTRLRPAALATLVALGALAVGCGANRPALPEGVDLDKLIAGGNLAFFHEPRPEGLPVAVGFDQSGGRVLTAHDKGAIVLWDANDGRAIAELAVHEGGAVAAEFSPDGGSIATAGARDSRVEIRSAATGALIATCEVAATAIAWSPDGARLAIGSRDGKATLCDAKTGKLGGSVVHSAAASEAGSPTATDECSITAVAWTEDGEFLATAGAAGVVTFWRASTLEAVHSDLGHAGAVIDLVPQPGTGRIASAGEDGTVQILEPDLADPVATFYNESVPVHRIAMSPDGERLAWGGADGRIKIWDTRGGEHLLALDAHRAAVTDLAWSPDGRRLISAAADGLVAVSDAESGGELLALVHRAAAQLPGRAAWSPDGRRLARAAGETGVDLWDPAAAAPYSLLSGPHHQPVAVAWSPDGRRLASAGRDEILRIWNSAIPALAGVVRDLDGPVLGVAWSPDEKLVAAAGWAGLRVLSATDGGIVLSSLEAEGAVNAISFAPDGARLASAGADGQVRIFVVADGTEARAFATGAAPVTALAWSADGTRLAVGADDGVVWIWNVETAAVEVTLDADGLGPVFGLDWSPLDARLAVVDAFGGLYLWSEQDGGALARVAGLGGTAWSVDWRPDGEFLLVGGPSGAWIHRLRDGARLTLEGAGPDGARTWLAFTDDGLFCGDQAAFPRLSFRVGDDLRAQALLPVEAMVELFYREDLLAEFLSGRPIVPPGN